MIKIGAHVKFVQSKKYFEGAIAKTLSYKANAFMIFAGPPQNSRRKSLSDLGWTVEKFAKWNLQVPFKNGVVHGPYIVNPANPKNREFTKELLTKDAKIADEAGLGLFVLHPGSNTQNLPLEESLALTANVVKHLIKNTKNVVIAIETMAMKGKQVGSNFKELKHMLDIIDSPRASICLDTCHVWDARYNIKDIYQIINEFDQVIGLERLSLVHLNDSKNPIGAKKDRHANIGKGFIGLETLRNFLHNPRLEHCVFILETPYVDGKPIYGQEIKLLK